MLISKSQNNLRSELADKKRILKKVSFETFVMLVAVVEPGLCERWLLATHSFPQILKLIGDEIFGEQHECTETWQTRLCEIITDVAAKLLPRKQWLAIDLSTPKLLCYWFADFLQTNLPKNDLKWDGNLFEPEALQTKIRQLNLRQ